jgi:hypothetical protein
MKDWVGWIRFWGAIMGCSPSLSTKNAPHTLFGSGQMG